MQDGFRPIGSALPPRRDTVSAAVAVVTADEPRRTLTTEDAIVVPGAQDRLLELIEREQMPEDVRQTLAGALSGDLRRQQLLFQAMVDTWPLLQKCLREIKLAVRNAPWRVMPWADRGEKPTPTAQSLAKDIERDLWRMRPDAKRNMKGLEGTLEEIATGYFFGHHVLEVNWERTDRYRPRATKIVPPRYYGYPWQTGDEDILMFDPDGQIGSTQYVDFPPHKFLIAINGGHPGHPTLAAPMRALATYWLAAVYGFRWLTQFAQICGIPFRWGEYPAGDEKSKAALSKALAEFASSGWLTVPTGAKVNFEDVGKNAGEIGQKVLLEVANEACATFMLGQNLTSSSGETGTQALGTVHAGVKQELVEGICDFVGEVVTHQLIPSMIELNYGAPSDEAPGFWPQWEKPRDLKLEAERFEKLKAIGVSIGKEWGHETLGVPIPSEGEELLFEAEEGEEMEVEPTKESPDEESEDMEEEDDSIEAADSGMPLTVDQLATAVAEGLTGVSREWLAPVMPVFNRLIALAMSGEVTDEDFIAAIEKAQRDMPELFDQLNAPALEEALMDAISSAALAGSTSLYE